MSYEEQLLTPEWKAKRQAVIDYFWGYCTKCMSSKNIQVHHKYYIEGRMAWEYPVNHCLITLCRDCHALEHDKVPERQPVKTIGQVMIRIIQGWINVRKNG